MLRVDLSAMCPIQTAVQLNGGAKEASRNHVHRRGWVYGPSKRAVTVLVGPGDLLLLGVTTLEALRLKVNPVDGKLEPTTPYLYAM
jgi:predicted aspartyl protease